MPATRTQSKPPRRHIFARCCLYATTLAAVLVSIDCGPAKRDYAVFQFVAGEVYILKDGSPTDRERAYPGATAGPSDVIETGEESAAELQVREMGIIRLGEKSRLKLGDLSSQGRLNIQMQKGRAGFLMKRLKSKQQFRVSTPTVVASVRGTSFLVGVYAPAEAAGAQSAPEESAGFSKVAMFDGALELGTAAARAESGNENAPTILDQPGEVRLKAGDRLTAESIQPLSAESIAEMKALEEMTSPGGRARPDADMIPPGQTGIVPRTPPLPLPEK